MKKYLTHISIFLFTFFYAKYSFGQRETTFHYDASAVLGTETTPFWMRANKYGAVPTKGQTMALFAGLDSDYEKSNKKIKWGYGLNIGAFLGVQNKFIAQEAYAKAKWRAFELYTGRRKEIQGLVDTTLSSGSYIWSGNALPMPKIDLSIPQYTSIGKSGIFSIKGNYAHGWFDRQRDDAVGVLLHQKSFYFRIGKPNYKLKFYGGFNHQAQWGGASKVLSIRKFESTFKDYLNIIMGKSNVGSDTTGLDPNSAGNRTGNHLGSFDIGLELNYLNSKIFFYRQSIFEDGSLFYLNNISDGLNGISISFKNNIKSNIKINKITFEFLNTLSQGGSEGSNSLSATKRGQDQYFNNAQYRDGWSYNKTSIGTPFILSKLEFPNAKTSTNTVFFTNNRLQSFYFGLNGFFLQKYNFESRISFSNNWGIYQLGFPEIKNQSSIFIKISSEFNQILGGVNGYLNLAGDFGDLLNSNYAIQLGIKKAFRNFPFMSHPTHKHQL